MLKLWCVGFFFFFCKYHKCPFIHLHIHLIAFVICNLEWPSPNCEGSCGDLQNPYDMTPVPWSFLHQKQKGITRYFHGMGITSQMQHQSHTHASFASYTDWTKQTFQVKHWRNWFTTRVSFGNFLLGNCFWHEEFPLWIRKIHTTEFILFLPNVHTFRAVSLKQCISFPFLWLVAGFYPVTKMCAIFWESWGIPIRSKQRLLPLIIKRIMPVTSSLEMKANFLYARVSQFFLITIAMIWPWNILRKFILELFRLFIRASWFQLWTYIWLTKICRIFRYLYSK